MFVLFLVDTIRLNQMAFLHLGVLGFKKTKHASVLCNLNIRLIVLKATKPVDNAEQRTSEERELASE